MKNTFLFGKKRGYIKDLWRVVEGHGMLQENCGKVQEIVSLQEK